MWGRGGFSPPTWAGGTALGFTFNRSSVTKFKSEMAPKHHLCRGKEVVQDHKTVHLLRLRYHCHEKSVACSPICLLGRSEPWGLRGFFLLSPWLE